MSCTIIVPHHHETVVVRTLFFPRKNDRSGGGYAFPCDENGNVNQDSLTAVAKEILKSLPSDPEYDKPYVDVDEQTRFEPDLAQCGCGEQFYLEGTYYGACRCPKCGKWYSMSGEDMLPPDRWGWETGETF